MIKNLFKFKPKACNCDACTKREPNRSRSPYVSHGLHMWVGKDNKFHYKAKSKFVNW